jgi:hypothetical protein
MAAWKLTVRDGSDVEHGSFDTLDEGIGEMRRRAMEIRAKGSVEAESLLRDFAPRDQVRARLQLSGKGLLRRRVAGIDVRGDGTLMPYRGTVRREELDPTNYDTPFDAVRETLELATSSRYPARSRQSP